MFRYLFSMLPLHWVLSGYGWTRRLLDHLNGASGGRAPA